MHTASVGTSRWQLQPPQGSPITTLPAANLHDGQYRYTADLLQLSVATQISPISHDWPRYIPPINMSTLTTYLNRFPDQIFARYIAEGLSSGFHIGYTGSRDNLRSTRCNHPSSRANSRVVDERISAELEAGRLLGPIPPHQAPTVHVSPLGLVPKKHQSNKWRLICDLSSPSNHSVNDGISPTFCSLHYASVDDAMAIIQRLGRNTRLIKLDIKDAYRIVPVHPADYALLGITWKNKIYVDRALPFGLRSAPKVFNALADLITWILASNGIQHQLHYLDDFLFLTTPDSATGSRVLAIALQTLHQLGIPVAANKTEGPTTQLTFLGIIIDTHTFELHLPQEKLLRLQEAIAQWVRKTCCTRKELECFLGHLSHAATVIRQGRTFLRNLFSLLSLNRAPQHYIRLNAGARADLLWWQTFLADWNGLSFFPSQDPSVEVVSDASGTFGCGAYCITQGWFQLQWPRDWEQVHITAKELLPIVIAASIWGHTWRRKRILFKSDNMAVVSILKTRTSRDNLLMHMLRCLSFYATFYAFDFESAHIPGTQNTAADAISRNNISLFLSIIPQAQHVTIPQHTIDLLVTKRPDWGSAAWTILFRASLTRDSPHPPERRTSQVGNDI